MSATTGNRGYPYPQLTDDVDVPGDLQALAQAVDVDVEALIGQWTNYTPTLYTTMGGTRAGITKTAGYLARYMLLPHLCIMQASVANGSGSSTTSGGGLSLPFPAVDAQPIIGSAAITGSSASTAQIGQAFLSGTDAIVCITPTTSFIDIPNGHYFRCSVMYYVA